MSFSCARPTQHNVRRLAALVGASLFAVIGCGHGSGSTSAGGSTSNGTGTSTGTSTASTNPGSCDSDPLKTGLAPLFNGNSVDAYDCALLKFTAKYNEPDAMVFKAIVYVESRFQFDAYGCTTNSGCCPQSNWSGEECGCLGVMQTGPVCGSSNGLGVLSNGHVNLDTNMSSADWANSVFNPEVNIELGIAGIAGNRAQEKKKFPGCTEDQYTMMAIGDFNSYGSTKSCTSYNTTYDNAVLDAYKQYSAAAGWAPHPY